MASIRKTKKQLKREAQRFKRLHDDVDDSFHGTAVEFVAEWLSVGTEVRLDNINIIRKLRAFNRRQHRKIRKQGKWQEYVELKKHMKHQQATTLPSWMLGLDYPPTDGRFREWFVEYLKQRK